MIKMAMGILLIGFLIFGLSAPVNSIDNKVIVVEIEKKSLQLFENGELRKEFPVRVGKEKTPTPIGEGYIYEKREKPIFRYTDPPNKGKIIVWSTLSDGRVIRMPYKDMRALAFRLNRYKTDKYSIHSISDPATIGQEISKGCIGMKIEDMLEFYSLVEKGTKITIKP